MIGKMNYYNTRSNERYEIGAGYRSYALYHHNTSAHDVGPMRYDTDTWRRRTRQPNVVRCWADHQLRGFWKQEGGSFEFISRASPQGRHLLLAWQALGLPLPGHRGGPR